VRGELAVNFGTIHPNELQVGYRYRIGNAAQVEKEGISEGVDAPALAMILWLNGPFASLVGLRMKMIFAGKARPSI
jgi:hypothetical protein